MTDPKKISRRDAIKLLGAAAGASILANLPSKWSKPSLVSGSLPVHAQSSCINAVSYQVLSANGGTVALGLINGPFPDDMLGDGSAGTTARWECQTGCLTIVPFLNTAKSGSVRITTVSTHFSLTLDKGNPFVLILIDMASGEFALNLVGSAAGCDWHPVKMPEGGWGNIFTK